MEQLQDWLVANGYMTQTQVNTGYGTYGPQTTAAVKSLQQKLGVNNSSGPGDYGPLTIAAVQKSGSSSSLGTNASNGMATYTTNPDGTKNVIVQGVTVGKEDAKGNFTPDTGSASLDSVVNSGQAVSAAQLAAGNAINPNLSITPQLVSQFLSEAHTQMDPEGQQNLTDEIEGINSSLQNLTTQYNNSVAQSQQTFQQNLNQERTASAGAGIAFSGERGLAEDQMLNSQNLGLSSLAANAQNQIGATLRSGGAAVGQGIPGLNGSQNDFQVPSLSTATSSLEGAFGGAGPSGNALNLNYNPGTYQVGSLGQSYQGALQSAQQQLTSNYLGTAANNSPSAAANGPTAASLS